MTKPLEPKGYDDREFSTAHENQESINLPSLREVFVGIDAHPLVSQPNSAVQNIPKNGSQARSKTGRNTSTVNDNAEFSDQEENEQFWNRTIRLATFNTGQFLRKKTLSSKFLPFVDTGKKSHLERFSCSLRKFLRQHMTLLAFMIISSIISFTLYQLRSRLPVSYETLWMPAAIPGLTIAVYILSYIAEKVLLKSALFPVVNPPWIVTVFVQSSTVWLRYFFLFGFLNVFLASWWKKYQGPGIIAHDVLEKIIYSIFSVIVLVMVRNVSLKLLRQRVACVSFGPEAENLYFIERFVFDVLCYQDPAMPSDMFSRCFSDALRTSFVSKLEWLKAGPLSLPLEQDKSEQWKFSSDSRVEVVSRREVEFMADVIYDGITHHNGDVITFETWERIFHLNTKAAKKAFRLLFSDSGFESKSEIDRVDFKTALLGVYRARSVLISKFTNFSNVFSLIHTASCSLFWICMLFFVANIFGYQFKELVVLLSTAIVSFSFAMSKSISRVVECAIFVFGSRPYTVNDIVIINDTLYVVKQISLLETRLQDRTNKIVRISNQKLCDADIINLSYSGDFAISLVDTELSIRTPVNTIERLRASVLTYARRHADQWKPRISMFMENIKQANSFRLQIYVESKIPWRDRTVFREADLELKRHICQKMVKLGLNYTQPKQSVEFVSSNIDSYGVSFQ